MKWNYKKFLRNMFYTFIAPVLILGVGFILGLVFDFLYKL